MRILILSAEYPPMLSGMGDYTKNLSLALKQAGCEIAVLTSGDQSVPEKDSGVLVFRSIQSWDTGAWPEIQRIIRQFNPDIFHIQYLSINFGNHLFINLLPQRLKRSFPDLKVVTTYHEFSAPWKRLALLPLFWNSDAHSVTNDRHYRFLRIFSRLLRIKGPTARIPLGANIFPYLSDPSKRKDYRNALGISDQEHLFVRFGILHDISLPEILKAASLIGKLRQEGFPLRLLLVGKSEPRAKTTLAAWIQDKGFNDWICLRFDQSEEDVSKCLHAGDVGLAVYLDGISEKRTAFLALLGHRVPVIGTLRGTLPSELKERENILCVPAEYKETPWMSAFREMVQNASLRSHIAEGGHHVYLKHQWHEIALKTIELYEEILK